MANHGSEHKLEMIRRAVLAEIARLKDPRLDDGFVNVLKITVSHDGSSCKIFVSSLEGIEKATEASEILTSASGHIRKNIGKSLKFKYIPNLIFIPSDAIEYGIKMSQRIDELLASDNNRSL